VPLHEWKYKGEYPPSGVVNEAGDVVRPEEPVENLVTWVFEEDSFVPCAKMEGEEKYSIVTDYLGTPTHAYNSAGAPVWERELDIYGKPRRVTGDKSFCPYLYQGQYVDDETGLAYNRFRYYDADAGSYISQDPIGLEGGATSFYTYVNDTNLLIDPAGLAATPGLVRYDPRRVTPVPGTRGTAIDRAWVQEKALLDAGHSGTRTWTQAEVNLIRSTPNAQLTSVMSRAGYTGHHINSVENNGAFGHAWQGDPRNIVFLENHNHAAGVNEHVHGNEGHRGSTRNATRGRLIDRERTLAAHNRTRTHGSH
jgi:RHS repeat-associated protein